MPPSRAARLARREFVAWMKERHNKCQSCRRRFRHYLLEFAHTEEDEKDDHIARIVTNGSTERLLQEIALTRLLCCNCHREETQNSRKPTRSRRQRRAQWSLEKVMELYEEWREETA